MVLGCDLDFPCFQVLNRVVAAPVAEFQLVGTRTVCKRNDLMPQANTKHRLEADQGTNCLDCVRNIHRISRTVGDKHPVRIQGTNPACGSIPWHNGYLAPHCIHGSGNVPLHATVNRNDMKTLLCCGK